MESKTCSVDYGFLRTYIENEIRRLNKIVRDESGAIDYWTRQENIAREFGKDKLHLDAKKKMEEAKIKYDVVHPKVEKLQEQLAALQGL